MRNHLSIGRPVHDEIGIAPIPGFTLVELLVVIAVISTLAAVLLPVLDSAKRKALQAQCLSDLKQTGGALQMYIEDNNDWLPPGR